MQLALLPNETDAPEPRAIEARPVERFVMPHGQYCSQPFGTARLIDGHQAAALRSIDKMADCPSCKHDIPAICGSPAYAAMPREEQRAFWSDAELDPPCRLWEPKA